MSQEYMEALQRMFALPFGGEEWLAAIEALTDPDAVLVDRTLPEVAEDLRGAAAMRAMAARMAEAFDDVSYVVEEAIDLDDRILLRVRGSARGKGSGMRIDGTVGQLFSIRGGKGVRLDVYGTWEEALDAVGLRE